MAEVSCSICGGSNSIMIDSSATAIKCQLCGSLVSLPRAIESQKSALYRRAEQTLFLCDFDHAQTLFQQILEYDLTDAHIHWQLLMCQYGVTYVQDYNGSWIPTINRTQVLPVQKCEHYINAIAYASSEQRTIFQAESSLISEIQEKTLEIAKNEAPYDVFISYKETDENDHRTPDSVIATNIYEALTDAGYRVFFSRRTLKDKLGSEYEPYIYSALSSAKAMLLISTKPEYLQSPWVKNEWKRYLLMKESNRHRHVISAYKGFSPTELPEEVSHLQAVNLDNPNYIDVVIASITDKIGRVENFEHLDEVSDEHRLANALLKAAYHLRHEEWKEAEGLIQQALDADEQNSEAYLLQLLLVCKKHDLDDLESQESPMHHLSAYADVINHCEDNIVERVKRINHDLLRSIEKAKELVSTSDANRFSEALRLIGDMKGYSDEVDDLIHLCQIRDKAYKEYLDGSAIIEEAYLAPLAADSGKLHKAMTLLDGKEKYFQVSALKAKFYTIIGDKHAHDKHYGWALREYKSAKTHCTFPALEERIQKTQDILDDIEHKQRKKKRTSILIRTSIIAVIDIILLILVQVVIPVDLRKEASIMVLIIPSVLLGLLLFQDYFHD